MTPSFKHKGKDTSLYHSVPQFYHAAQLKTVITMTHVRCRDESFRYIFTTSSHLGGGLGVFLSSRLQADVGRVANRIALSCTVSVQVISSLQNVTFVSERTT